MIDLSVPCSDPAIFLQRFADRLRMCRDCDCLCICFQVNSDHIRLRDIHGNLCKLFATPIENLAITWINHSGPKGSSTLACDPLVDDVVFEDIYMFFHHQNFSLCRLKSSKACAPLDRIEKVEALVGDLMKLIKNPQE